MFYLNSKSMRNVCGLDVHKDNVFVCIDKENGEKIQFKAGVLTKELDALCETLVANDVTEIAMESTSVYRMPIWRVLENDYKMLYQLSYGTYIYKKESLRRMTLCKWYHQESNRGHKDFQSFAAFYAE